jgi:hypothetical protein
VGTLADQTGHVPKALTQDKRKTMVTTSKLTVLFALAVVGVAFPAIAQSFDPEAGTGNVLPFSDGVPAAQNYQITAPTNGKIAARHRDLYGYATVPRRRQLQSHRASYSRVLDHTFGMSPRERTNLNCDGIAPGHPYGSAGARFSQAIKELATLPQSNRPMANI